MCHYSQILDTPELLILSVPKNWAPLREEEEFLLPDLPTLCPFVTQALHQATCVQFIMTLLMRVPSVSGLLSASHRVSEPIKTQYPRSSSNQRLNSLPLVTNKEKQNETKRKSPNSSILHNKRLYKQKLT